ncbi:MAG: biotin transporter BioY [Oscillospiraceae bacterium]|nr:biotin transporter BioY [Oscillospiraceae bacterium]
MVAATKSRSKIYDMAFIAISAAIMAVCSWISIPGPVPFTLQTFGVFVTVGILGGKRGTLAVLIYILLGAIGVPVFAGFSGGFGVLLSSTGGYIIGFLFTALIMWLFEKLPGNKTLMLVLSMLAGLLVCYAFGTAWFMVVYAQSTGPVGLGAALMWCVVPFIIPDLVKLGLAFVIATRVRKYVA